MANPIVKLRPHNRRGRLAGWVVWCMTGDCEYVDTDATKTYAQEMQRRHARDHRSGRISGVQSE